MKLLYGKFISFVADAFNSPRDYPKMSFFFLSRKKPNIVKARQTEQHLDILQTKLKTRSSVQLADMYFLLQNKYSQPRQV